MNPKETVFWAPATDSGGIIYKANGEDGHEKQASKKPCVVLTQSLQEELRLLGLSERLDRVLQEYPDRYQPDTISRVREIIHHDIEEPNKRRSPNLFQTINDFQLYYLLHPEWQGRSPGEMDADTESGAAAFYGAFTKWTRNEAGGDPQKRRELTERIFHLDKASRANLTTIEAWLAEFQSHPEWQERTPGEMADDKESGASAFYGSFSQWVRKEAKGDPQKGRELTERIFHLKRLNHANLATIEDWLAEFQAHPEWQGRTQKAMRDDKDSGANAFYMAFTRWVRKEAGGDPQKGREFRERIFHTKQVRVSRANLTTIGDWLAEFQAHPEWQGRTPKAMRDNEDSGANAFYKAFNQWLRKTAKTEDERTSYIKIIFPAAQHQGRKIKKQKEPISPEEAWEDLERFLEVEDKGEN